MKTDFHDKRGFCLSIQPDTAVYAADAAASEKGSAVFGWLIGLQMAGGAKGGREGYNMITNREG